jgi:hypothetical protein
MKLISLCQKKTNINIEGIDENNDDKQDVHMLFWKKHVLQHA